MSEPTAGTPTFDEPTAPADTENDLDLEVEDDANLDVDVPDDNEDTETVPADAGTDGAPAKPAKAARPAAPQGYVKPVAFAKLLTEHLGKAVPPQVVYSYIKNNVGTNAKHPFPVHSLDGYDWYIKPEEGLAWWDEKNTRVSSSKAVKAAKDAAKAAKATEAPAAASEGTAVEAE
jgi:hypothetical protein